MTRLVEAILKAQGYTTYRSPEGADGGADVTVVFIDFITANARQNTLITVRFVTFFDLHLLLGSELRGLVTDAARVIL